MLLPDTKSSVRWVQFDAPDFAKALKAAGVTYMITNALNDPQKQKSQAQACLAAGAKVVIETSLDNGSAAAIEKLFTSSGGKAIDYDRQVVGGTASVYVTFDGKAVGEAQANGIIAAMKAKGKYGRSPSSPSSGAARPTRTRSGSRAATTRSSTRSSRASKLTKGPQQFVPDWLATNAGADLLADAHQDEQQDRRRDRRERQHRRRGHRDLKAKHLKPIPLSGQDATPQGVQYILAGWQTGTVYKYVPHEAKAAAAAAVALLQRQEAEVEHDAAERQQEGADVTIPVVWITKANYKRLFTDGFLKRSQVCIGTVHEVLQVIR